jgi:hypothetical protein
MTEDIEPEASREMKMVDEFADRLAHILLRQIEEQHNETT